MRMSDWSSDVCSSDLQATALPAAASRQGAGAAQRRSRPPGSGRFGKGTAAVSGTPLFSVGNGPWSSDMAAKVPVLVPEGNPGSYLQEISKFPMLEQNEEYMRAKAWRERGDTEAAHKLLTAHRRPVAKIQMVSIGSASV